MDQRKIDKAIELIKNYKYTRFGYSSTNIQDHSLINELADYIANLYDSFYDKVSIILRLLTCAILILSGSLLYESMMNYDKMFIIIISIIMFILSIIILIFSHKKFSIFDYRTRYYLIEWFLKNEK